MHEHAKALYLFPTKALAQDQVAELLELNTAGRLGVRAFTFDGDTPGDARRAVRIRGDIVVSNPDMLHQGILPHHTKWAQFFENLRYVVIDELHTYRGVFGSHMANVIRRLRRVCRFYRSEPLFICCSATIANPAELASQLVGDTVTAITESGAPQGAKHLLLWNPPVINPDLGLRASARSQTTRIARSAIKAGLKTIIFANSRLMVEVLTKYLKDVFDHDPTPSPRALRPIVAATFRRSGGRRKRSFGRAASTVSSPPMRSSWASTSEHSMFASSTAIPARSREPGNDWDALDGAIAPSLGVLVATSEPLDQYIVRNPAFFTGASPEHARVAPDQLLILMDHVRCAAFELPFTADETFGGENLVEMLAHLEAQGVLHREGNRWHWMADSYPASSVSLRSVADGNFVVVDITGGKQEVIAEVDYSSAALTLYEGAIYMVQAAPWQVERLDWKGRKAFVTKTNADYYTDAIDYTRLKILDRFEDSPRATSLCARGEVHVVRRVSGYKKIRYYTHENVGYGPVNLPDHEMHTTAVWWQVEPVRVASSLRPIAAQALDGFLGAAYAIHSVAVLLTMSDRHDLGRAIGDGEGQWFATTDAQGRGKLQGASGEGIELDVAKEFIPTLFLYDNYPGGIGLSVPLYDLRDEVIAGARALVSACECRFGCPACVGPILATDEAANRSPKIAALRVLDLLGERKA